MDDDELREGVYDELLEVEELLDTDDELLPTEEDLLPTDELGV